MQSRLNQYHNIIMVIDGADGRTRTDTAYATAPSRRRVYQFHHIGIKEHIDTSVISACFQRSLGQVLWLISHRLRYIRGWCCFNGNRCRLNRHLHLCHTPSFNTLCCKISQSQTGDKKQCRQNGGCPCQKGCGSLTAKYGIGSSAAKGGPDISALAALNQDQPDQDNGN